MSSEPVASCSSQPANFYHVCSSCPCKSASRCRAFQTNRLFSSIQIQNFLSIYFYSRGVLNGEHTLSISSINFSNFSNFNKPSRTTPSSTLITHCCSTELQFQTIARQIERIFWNLHFAGISGGVSSTCICWLEEFFSPRLQTINSCSVPVHQGTAISI